MYTATHYANYTTQKRANIAQAALYAKLIKKLNKYNAKHNTNYVLQATTQASVCNTQVYVTLAITCKKYKQAVKLFNKTVSAFYKQLNDSHDSNSFVVCTKTNAQVY